VPPGRLRDRWRQRAWRHWPPGIPRSARSWSRNGQAMGLPATFRPGSAASAAASAATA